MRALMSEFRGMIGEGYIIGLIIVDEDIWSRLKLRTDIWSQEKNLSGDASSIKAGARMH